MKRHLHYLLVVLLLTLTACSTLNLPKPETPSERLAAGYATVTAVRSLATSGLQSGLIDSAAAQYVQIQCDLARAFLDAARSQVGKDDKSALDKIGLTTDILTKVQAYLTEKGVK